MLAVNADGGTLTIEGERTARLELGADGRDQFQEQDKPVRVNFVRGADGQVSGLSLSSSVARQGGAVRTLTRFSETPVKLNHFRDYTRTEAMVPMRDGVKLHVVILRPAGSETSGEPLPFLMERTPYGADGDSSLSVNATKPELAASGYIFVYGDIRGRYKSEGQFVMNRPIVAHKTKNGCGRDDGYATTRSTGC